MSFRRLMFTRKKLLLCGLLAICGVYALVLLKLRSEDSSRTYKLSAKHQLYSSHSSKHASVVVTHRDEIACKRPNLEPFASDIKRFMHSMDPVKCSDEEDWVIVADGKAKVSDHLLKKDSKVECSLTYLKRINDEMSHKGRTLKISTSNPEVTLEEDFFWIKCRDQESSSQWSNIMAAVHRDEKVVKRSLEMRRKDKDNVNKLNVLMFGYDSVSKMHFIRQMPKTYKHLVEKMNATVLQTYNIVGDGTPQALTPILTGFAEPELPEVRKRISHSSYVDVYPFIWKNFTAEGYVTQWIEDGGNFGTYTYRLRGFKEKPTDHYGRYYNLEAQKEYSKHKTYCLGSQSRLQIMLKWTRQLFDVYPDIPKFSFGFHSEYSHDDFNLLQVADQEMKEWLENLQSTDILDNTVLIVMSDHGNRFSTIRETQQGKLEERMPFFSIVLPKWFESKFPNAVRNLRVNAEERLMTPFDIHATFLTIINSLNHGQDVLPVTTFGNQVKLPRSISLFELIPKSRSCDDAGIEAHWCTCLSWQALDLEDPVVVEAAETLVEFINGLTAKVRDLCSPLKLDKITRAEKAQPNSNLLAFKQSKDHDGFVPDLSDHTKVSDVVYQVQIVTSPSQGIYEATLYYNDVIKSFTVSESQISRVNMYGNQPHCILQTHQGLRKYCYCSVQL